MSAPSQHGSFEDQIRNMLNAGPSAPKGSQQPNVRLPPPTTYAHAPHYPAARGSHGPSNSMRQQQRPQRMQLDPSAYQRPGLAQAQQNRMPLDPNGFSRRGPVPQPHSTRLYNPNATTRSQQQFHAYSHQRQVQYLENVAKLEISKVEMSEAERNEKESFRQGLQAICQEVCAADPDLPQVALECFGSFQSGFASAGSDMDLVIVVKNGVKNGNNGTSGTACFSLLEFDLPRALEKRLLQLGYGTRLLSRTRVPIIKVCERPSADLLSKFRDERRNWEDLPAEKKHPHLYPAEEKQIEQNAEAVTVEAADVPQPTANTDLDESLVPQLHKLRIPDSDPLQNAEIDTPAENGEATIASDSQQRQQTQPRHDRPWTRERKAGPLDFPKEGVGIQSDINFFNPLGLHNTQLLLCYSLCDSRVRPMVLFVKAWAKQRRINSAYSGTLSSYGYVLMVLHYLTNVVKPAVLPNLQSTWRPSRDCTPPGATRTVVDEWVVDFWQSEEEIIAALQKGQMSNNRESLGSLLAGFFTYYSSLGRGPQFQWMRWVLSLRTVGSGILTKEEKGWVRAATTDGAEGKKVMHRYLLCIEDPFELGHNVARTVTHPGLVAIRDEFRRAYRILVAVGNGGLSTEGELFDALKEDTVSDL